MRTARRLLEPRAISVTVDEAEAPQSVGRVTVEAIREDWTVGPIGWYTGHSVRRHYYELVLAKGKCTTVFRDLRSDRWYRQGA